MKSTLPMALAIFAVAASITAAITSSMLRPRTPVTTRSDDATSDEASATPSRKTAAASPLLARLEKRLAAAVAQAKIVAKLKQHGYHITYDYLTTPSSDPAPAVERLVAEYGPDFVGKPFYIGIPGRLAHLELLQQLPSLRNVDLDDSGVSDEDLRHLQGMPNLRVMFLNNTTISSKGLAYLVDSPIETIHLNNCDNIDDSAVPLLAKIQSLKHIYIDRRSLSDAALKQLREALPDCEIP